MSVSIKNIKSRLNNGIIKNSLWGAVSNVLQNILYSVFFIVLARKYSTDDFGNYVIANTIYSFVLGFSSLGLGHWFIRELINNGNKKDQVDKFFKLQLLIGIVFYCINIIISFLLYKSQLIRTLSLLIGINIIFDNIIYVIKSLNIADGQQRKTFFLLTLEAFLKFLVACVIFIYPFDITYLSVILILLRLITLNLFIKFGSSGTISLFEIIKVSINWHEIKNVVFSNWAFIIISSLSVVNWRIGNILVSKILTLKDVADYEISFKFLSIAYLIPIVVTSTLYPKLINAHKEGIDKMNVMYKKAFLPLSAYGFLAFSFVYSYADYLIPFLFGNKFSNTGDYCREMFLVMLVFPTIFLQANVLLTLKLEKLDMLCNITSVIINVAFCLTGLYLYKSLSVVNYAIFFSFLIFHLIQDFVLVRRKVSEKTHVFKFYFYTVLFLFTYYYGAKIIPKEILFVLFWLIASIALFLYYKSNKRKETIRFNKSINN